MLHMARKLLYLFTYLYILTYLLTFRRLLDLSAALDAIDHGPFHPSAASLGIDGESLSERFRTCMIDRCQSVL